MSTTKRTRLNPFQHALKRPDTYIGSAKTVTSDIWIFDDDEKIAVQKRISTNSGLFNIVREILSNSIDNVWRSKEKCPETPVKKIEITINSSSGEISIWNDGYSIRVHQEESEYTEPRTNKTITEKLYPAELFFGDMFTGTNYDDEEIRKTSGRNGMGAKTTNVFSKEFKVECFCPEDKAKFFQEYRNNGTERDQPIITNLNIKTGYTLISFTPDYEFFKYPNSSKPGIDKNFISLLKLYAYEVSMITGVMVKFNVDEESTSVKVNTLEKYARLFYPQIDKNKMTTFRSPSGDDCVLVEGDEPEIDASENISQISFVNGIRTKAGGVHVETWKDAVIPAIVRAFNSRSSRVTKEKVQVKTTAKEVYPYLHMFIRVEVDKPKFSSQTKDEFIGESEENKDDLTGYKLFNARSKKEREEWTKILDTAIKKIMKWNFIFLLEDKLLSKMDRNNSRKEGSSRKVRMGSKATDANEAGGKNSHLCTVYIAEGQSAGAFIGRGISSVPKGQDFNGVYCIKGKFINVQNASIREINNNEEVQQLKKFLGLRSGIDYSDENNFKTLRYGKVCILTDADDDGIHIRGLLLNFFYTGYSELVKRGYIDSFSTAVASAILKKSGNPRNNKGVTTNPGKLLFYSNPEFRKWYCIQDSEKIKNMEVEYYKGLGSIDPLDASKYFSDPKVVTYFMEGDEKDYMDLGFNEKCSDWRKAWITRDMIKKESDTLDLEEEESVSLDDEDSIEKKSVDFIYEGKLGLSSFVDNQLIIYHRMALRRALPSIWDGFKESQRKILFTIFKRNYTKVRDIESIAGAVKEEAKYHHGSSSCEEAIIKMAQGFVGSNNIPLLSAKGELGTRHKGGRDHAAARYPKTMAEEITRIIFNVHDEPLLERLIEDNESVEYKFFMPIIPTILINGAHGISSGFFTQIPCYNPLEIVKWIELWLEGKSSEALELVPWYRGFKGPINLVKSKTGETIGWKSKGILEKGTGKEKDWWHIRDLPIGIWTDNFKEWLEYLETSTAPKDKKWKKREVRGLSDIKSYCTPNTIHFMIKPTKDFIPDMDVPNNLKVMQKLRSFKNMVVIDENNYPHRFDSPEEILQFFCPTRLKYYALRKNYILKVLRNDFLKASNRYRFIKGVKDMKLDLYKSEDELEKILSEKPWRFDKVESGQNKELSYDYLLSMQMRSMTVKKLEELKREKEKLTKEIEIIESKSFKDLWKEDLQKFKVAYSKFLKTRSEE